jgi:hypothetical protein
LSAYKIRVSGRPRGDEQDGVDDVRETFDTGVVDSDDERTGSGIASTRQKSGVIVGNEDGNHPDL